MRLYCRLERPVSPQVLDLSVASHAHVFSFRYHRLELAIV